MKSKVTLKEEMHFVGELDGHSIMLDADEAFGGKNKGSKPKGLILTALAGCTAMDVISILRKKRVFPKGFSVEVEAPVTDMEPKIFKSFKIYYKFKGDLSKETAKRAIDLSLEHYCGVAEMLRKVGPVEYEIIIEN